MDCDLNTTIPDWIIEHPETTGVFNELELDVSCGGKSLQYVASQKGLEPHDVIEQLRRQIAGGTHKDSR